MTPANLILTSHQFEGRSVRSSITESGEPLFVVADVCAILAHSNPTEALRGLEADEIRLITLSNTEGIRGNPKVNAVTESGLYALIFSSRKPEAKRFRKWVTSEVLPALRKQGIYRMAAPGTLSLIAQLKLRLEAAECRAKAQVLERIARDDGIVERPEGWVTIPEFISARLPKTDWRHDSACKRLGWLVKESNANPADCVRSHTGNSMARRVFRPELLTDAWPTVAAAMGL